jgi:hypothetical protein
LAQRLVSTKSVLVLEPGAVPSPMTSTIVPGNLPLPTIQYQKLANMSDLIIVFVNPENSNDRSGLQSIANYLCTGIDGCFIWFYDNLDLVRRKISQKDISGADPAIIASYSRSENLKLDELKVCGQGDCIWWREMVGKWQSPVSSTTYEIALQNEQYVVTSISCKGITYSIISQSSTGSTMTWSYIDSTRNLSITITNEFIGQALSSDVVVNWSFSDGRSGEDFLKRVQ